MSENNAVIYAMGDVVSQRDDFNTVWDPILPIISKGDIRYCQAEQILSDKEGVAPNIGYGRRWRFASKFAAAYKYAGIDVASVNGNHALEFGYDGLFDTLSSLEKNGVKTCGGGKNIEEARKPAILDRKGIKVAFLAYASIMPPIWSATATMPGLAPMRIHTYYQQIEPNQPATPSAVHSFPYSEDLEDMKADIRQAKRQADFVAIALHWGVHYQRATMAEYQFLVAHAAIEAGADMIFGTHPHLLKAIEVYQGKPIFYSLGNFAVGGKTKPGEVSFSAEGGDSRDHQLVVKAMGMKEDPEFAWLGSRPRDIFYTGIAKVEVGNHKIVKVSFIPIKTTTTRELLPLKTDPGTKAFDEVVSYQKDITSEAGIKTNFKVEGGELVIGI